MKEFELKDYKVFELFRSGLALAVAGDLKKHNACTIGWGSLGTLWVGKSKNGQMVTVYLHPDRYTCELFKENDTFSVCFFNEEYRKEIAYMGSHTGKKEDKTKGSGLTAFEINGTLAYKEAKLIFVCKKMYQSEFAKDGLNEDVKNYYINNPSSFPLDENGDWHPHMMFIGEIEEVIEK